MRSYENPSGVMVAADTLMPEHDLMGYTYNCVIIGVVLLLLTQYVTVTHATIL
jgi:hypothetical protein